MDTSLDDLAPEMRPLAFELLARACEAGIPVAIVNTLRTEAQQLDALHRGVSWTAHSRHLPQPGSGKARAIDICPFLEFRLKGPDKLAWDRTLAVWNQLGEIGERVGLVWGGRWRMRDLGHFELPASVPAAPAAEEVKSGLPLVQVARDGTVARIADERK